jgi:hypothetical protein
VAPFSAPLRPPFGVFYQGWRLLLEAEHAAFDTTPQARALLLQHAEPLAVAFRERLEAGSPFLESYPGQAWPVDSVVAVAALRRVGQVTGVSHDALIQKWLEGVGGRLDSRTGLIPHRVDPVTGEPIEGARGSSQSIIQRYWPMVDPEHAAESYRRFRERFVRARFGFVGVQEYPDGVTGAGDVDSGPLIFGLTLSGSAVTIGAARANGDLRLSRSILHELDVIGLPVSWNGERRYLFGLMPIGDAFATWARSTPTTNGADYPALLAWWPAYLLAPWAGVALAWRRVRFAHAKSFLGQT